jgi:m7GpppX diphosphatase
MLHKATSAKRDSSPIDPVETRAAQRRRTSDLEPTPRGTQDDETADHHPSTPLPSSPTTPGSLIGFSECLAQSLTVSNDHATILLRTNKNREQQDGASVQSLLKLTVLPSHTTILTPSSDIRALDHPQDVFGVGVFNADESTRIKGFLASFQFELHSESGAEYSYYNAVKKASGSKTAFEMLEPSQSLDPPSFRVELISPASEKQLQRAMPTPALVLVEETPQLYQQVVAPYIQSVVESGSLQWVENIVTGKKETERLLLDAEGYVLNVDTKWKTHPDAMNVPKELWKKSMNKQALEDLYCLAIVKDSGIATIRDLREAHLPMLRDIQTRCPRVLEEVYGVPKNQLRIFLHYQPQFYHLHFHLTRLENGIGCEVERGHLLADVIQNLEMDGEYYVRRTITYKLRTNEALAKRLTQVQE